MAKTNRENRIEFTRNAPSAGVTITQRRYKSRIEKLAADYPDKCVITARNADGSLEAQIPTEWIRINPGRQIKDESRGAMSQRAEHMREAVKGKTGIGL